MKQTLDDSRNRVKYHGGEDEGRQWTRCAEEGRDTAIRREEQGQRWEKRTAEGTRGERNI